MDSFVGNQLKEMTEMRFARKQHIVLISSGVATAIFSGFCFLLLPQSPVVILHPTLIERCCFSFKYGFT